MRPCCSAHAAMVLLAASVCRPFRQLQGNQAFIAAGKDLARFARTAVSRTPLKRCCRA